LRTVALGGLIVWVKAVQASVVHPRQSELGEGSLWDVVTQRLYWVDIVQGRVMIYDPVRDENTEYDVGQSVGTVVLTEGERLLLGVREGIASFDLRTRVLDVIHRPEPDLPGNRLNDGKCDPAGRFVVGSIVERGSPGTAALYALDPELRLRRLLSGVTISNGLVWSADGRYMYYIDTPTGLVQRYDYDLATGTLAHPRTVTKFQEHEGAPDGMSIDADGALWVATWGGSGVWRVHPESGERHLAVSVPARNVTSCAFGGRDLNELYITTARAGLDAEALDREPDSGSLFRVAVDARGVPDRRGTRGRARPRRKRLHADPAPSPLRG
jgi:sugar lactone lactonase YvrE